MSRHLFGQSSSSEPVLGDWLTQFVERVILSFLIIHKVGNIGIFAQFLMEINWKQLPVKDHFLLDMVF